MKKYLYMIAALFGIDYFCKENIEAQKPEDFPRDMEKSHGKIRLYRNHNDGFCFGVKKEKKELVRMVPVVFTSAAAGILTWLLCRDEGRKADRIGFALITAGGLSNLYDRLKRGYVVDYFSIRCKYLEKIVFNLGDFFIFAGSALIAASDLLGAVRDLSSPAEAHIKALRLPWRKTDEAE